MAVSLKGDEMADVRVRNLKKGMLLIILGSEVLDECECCCMVQ